MVVIRSAGLSTKQQQGFIQPVFTPLVDVDGMKKFVLLYIIIMWLLCDWPVSVSLSPCGTVQKSSPGYLKRVSTLQGRGRAFLSLSGYLLVCSRFTSLRCVARVRDAVLWSAGSSAEAITWRRAWCPGRRPVGGGSTSRCSVSASPRTSWRWTRRRTPFGRTCLETGNGTEEYLREGVLKYGLKTVKICNVTRGLIRLWRLYEFLIMLFEALKNIWKY